MSQDFVDVAARHVTTIGGKFPPRGIDIGFNCNAMSFDVVTIPVCRKWFLRCVCRPNKRNCLTLNIRELDFDFGFESDSSRTSFDIFKLTTTTENNIFRRQLIILRKKNNFMKQLKTFFVRLGEKLEKCESN